MTDVAQDLQDLKKEADDLGVTYPKNITAEKLTERINDFYESKTNSIVQLPPEPVVTDEKVDKAAKKAAADAAFLKKRLAREKAARETRIVTIIDNDQRVNNYTTTCTVNCSNEYFDLGTMVLPLNEKIEVAMGHIRVLESVQIPLHVANKAGISSVRMRPRYTISYENNITKETN